MKKKYTYYFATGSRDDSMDDLWDDEENQPSLWRMYIHDYDY